MIVQSTEKRLRLGIIFNYSLRWMGGIVYIINLIKTLGFLDDEDKPEIILFYRSDLKNFLEEINYPYLLKVEWKFPAIIPGYIQSWILSKNIFVDEILKQYNLDGLYPLHDLPVRTNTRTKLVSWYADLQHKYYPEFFTRRKIVERNTRIRFMLNNGKDLIVSSQSVADDFTRFYSLNNSLKLHVFHFVSVVDDIEKLDINMIKVKYGLPSRYFMISNQFPVHKNHRILFKALALLKETSEHVHFVITGKFPDKERSHYALELHNLIEENKLQNQITLLGVIQRAEQITLMRYSQAVIQPSLFEGWSTVIEDARSLQVPVIASNIPANVEQLGQDGIFFEPHDEKKLAEIICTYPERKFIMVSSDDYNARIRNAATVFINIFRN